MIESENKALKDSKLISEGQTKKIEQKLVEAETKVEELNITLEAAAKLKSDPNFENEEEMEITAKDAILAVPIFSGDSKDLDAFISTCDLYFQLIADAQKPSLLLIVKAKIRGEALTKVSPLDDCTTWALLKARLKERLKKPVSLEYAQEDLNNVFQKNDESIEEYGKRVRAKLRKLNEACNQVADTQDGRAILHKANEKLAISKFEQNIRQSTIRILVAASSKASLDEAIQIALQKDLMERNKNIRSCSF